MSWRLTGNLLHEARYELWSRWHASADPVAAAALRLTLETPLDQADPAGAARLVGEAGEAAGNLLRLVLSRADERQYERAQADDANRVAADDARVAELNLVAETAGATRIQPCPLERPPRNAGSDSRRGLPLPSRQRRLDQGILPELPAGALGLNSAIHAWHTVPFDDLRASYVLDRFAGLIGYRLVELAGSGREPDAAAALRVLGGSASYSEGALLLRALAEGLERHGHQGLAAQAYTLAWTRARGGRGWLNFGGQTVLDALQNATRLDPATATDVVTEETERIVASGRYGTSGVIQALIIAFAANALTRPGTDSVDTAFAMWEEALAVIADRAPRVDDTDDPDQPYRAPDPDDGSRMPGDLDVAFAKAALAGLAHAGRESKRRSLLAVHALITQRPDIAASAAAMALAALSDPATLTWLLCLIGDHDIEGKPIAKHGTAELRALAQGSHLTIRAIARRLLLPGDAATVPLGPSDASLLTSPGSALWVPDADDDDADAAPTELVSEVAGARLIDSEPLLPELAEAVLPRVARDYASPELRSRMKVQLRAYRDNSMRHHRPDAYLAIEQAVEDALQRTAAGARAARLAAGLPTADPVGREDELARALTASPQIPLALEATRCPRPLVPPPASKGAPLWAAVAAAARGTATGPATVLAARTSSGKLMATTAMRPARAVTIIDGGPYNRWCVIGTAERRICPGRRYGEDDHQAFLYTALEARRDGDGEALERLPFTAGSLLQWIDPLPAGHVLDPLAETQPLLGIDSSMTSTGDAASGLGVPPEILVPASSLVAALGLRPAQPMTLDDDVGPSLALITWRTCYEQSEYHLAWPRVVGCAVVLRPDLMLRLSDHSQATLVMREFVIGDDALAEAID